MMAYNSKLRIYDGVCNKTRRFDKGKKKKRRRNLRADHCDGWSRKRAGGLKPAFRTSKSVLYEELHNEENI